MSHFFFSPQRKGLFTLPRVDQMIQAMDKEKNNQVDTKTEEKVRWYKT